MTTITTDEVMVLMNVKQAWHRQRFRQHEQRLVEEFSQFIHGQQEEVTTQSRTAVGQTH